MKVQIQILFNKQWYDIDIENLRKDNTIRVYQDSELVKDEFDFTIRKCLNDVIYDETLETWTIKSIDIKLDENMEEIDNHEISRN